jgi:hypothetical protein
LDIGFGCFLPIRLFQFSYTDDFDMHLNWVLWCISMGPEAFKRTFGLRLFQDKLDVPAKNMFLQAVLSVKLKVLSKIKELQSLSLH